MPHGTQQLHRRRPRSMLLFFNDTATTEIYTLSLHDALPIWMMTIATTSRCHGSSPLRSIPHRSEEHTSELQSPVRNLVCRLLLEKKKTHQSRAPHVPNTAIPPAPTALRPL